MKWSEPTQDRDSNGEAWWITYTSGNREARFTHEEDAIDFADYMNDGE